MDSMHKHVERVRHIYVAHTTVFKRGAFIVASVLCGALIAYTQLIPNVLHREVSTTGAAVAEQQQPTTPTSDVRQNNPLFAASPSWSQDFTRQAQGGVDARYWNILVGPAENSNKEQQYYTDSAVNLRVEDGALRLIATKQTQPQGYQYGSARLETQNKQSFTYGRFDIVAKLPSGTGTWPAVWLLPATDTYAKKSPESNLLRYKNGGEIDIVEAVGFEPDIIYGVAHTASDITNRPDGTGRHGAVNVPKSTTNFNTYSLLWTPTKLTYMVNNVPFYTYTRPSGADYKTWPFDQPFYMIVNLAMGGTWGGMDTARFPGTGIDNKALPASLDIRSIHYYPYTGSRTLN